MKAIKFIIVAFVLIVIAAAVFLFSSLDSVVKKGIETVGSNTLGVPVTVDKVNISLKEGSAEISGLKVGNPEGYKSKDAFYLGKIRLAIDPSSITSNVINVKDITIISPQINYELLKGKTNISVIRDNLSSRGSSEPSGSSNSTSNNNQKSFVIDNVVFADGKVNTYIGELNKTVNLPEIKMQGIGSQSNPASAKQVAKILLAKVLNTVAQNTDLKALSSELKGTAENIKNKVKDVGGNLKNLKGIMGN
jgi:uncharacterized protein involved in outer membrane biogenesis